MMSKPAFWLACYNVSIQTEFCQVASVARRRRATLDKMTIAVTIMVKEGK